MTENLNQTVKTINPKIYAASNVLNIIASVLVCVIFVFVTLTNDKKISEFHKDSHMALTVCCFIIPLLLAITLKFVFAILNDRNIIVQNGLLFLILNIILLVVGIVLLLIFLIFDDDIQGISKTLKSFNKYFLVIISFICLIVAIFTIIERIRKKNNIHLFFLIFYTIVIVISCVVSILLFINI